MPVEHGSESNYAKEMRRWESHHTKFGPPGRAYTFQEFPKRLYKAEHVSGKGIEIVDAQTAADEQAERNLLSRGFHFGQQAAIDAIRDEQTVHGTLAAERNWEIQHGRLSEKAAAEVAAAEAEHGAKHLPMVPETPIKRRVRRTKAQMAADAAKA